ncbi:hypothetical protein EON63_24415 [archaeon]|nr:MAG: hypothetical protein EON63_24415 [archaeon]
MSTLHCSYHTYHFIIHTPYTIHLTPCTIHITQIDDAFFARKAAKKATGADAVFQTTSPKERLDAGRAQAQAAVDAALKANVDKVWCMCMIWVWYPLQIDVHIECVIVLVCVSGMVHAVYVTIVCA